MALLSLFLMVLGGGKATAGEVIPFPLWAVPAAQAEITSRSQCEVFLLETLQGESTRVQDLVLALNDLIRRGPMDRQWMRENLQASFFHRFIAPGFRRLRPTPLNSVVVSATRAGAFKVIQVVSAEEQMDAIQQLDMNRRFGGRQLQRGEVGFDIQIGRQVSRRDALTYAAIENGRSVAAPIDEDRSPHLVSVLELAQNLLATGVVEGTELIGHDRDYVMSTRGSRPPVVWASLRLIIDKKRLSPKRLAALLNEVGKVGISSSSF